MNDPIEHMESEVRGYARLFPTVFQRAQGSILQDATGREFIDFFCGAGTLNYGHNNPLAKAALLAYIQSDGIQHSLDTVTEAKVDFIETFDELVLKPRNLDYKIQFTGPTGTNAVEAAIKLARKQTGRSHVIAFTHGYHGHTLGALALTANEYYHDEHYGSRNNVTHMPFDGYVEGLDSAALLEQMLADPSSGLPKPAAIVLETIQGEGGVNVASELWLCRIAEICRAHDILLIVDDIQVGNGRSGKFFSFEYAGIRPDIVCLSKSIGGGLPLSILLIDRSRDAWQPGQHTGTFRGNNLAFVAARAVLEHWRDETFEDQIEQRGRIVRERLTSIAERYVGHGIDVRGRGMIWGLDVRDGEIASRVIRRAFENNLLMESSGAFDEVLKVMPALTIDLGLLDSGLNTLEAAVDHILVDAPQLAAPQPTETPNVAITDDATLTSPVHEQDFC